MMQNRKTNILIFSKSDTILHGLYKIVNDLGIEPILIKNMDDFFDYPHLLGYVLLILPQKLYNENLSFLEKHFASAVLAKYLFFNTNEIKDNEINIDDSAAIIQHKIQNEIDSFLSSHSSQQPQELTHREIEVLKLIAHGFTNKEIADQLSISTHTVISHRKNLSEKTGIKTISGLTMYALIKQFIEIKDINTDNLK